MSDFEVKTGSLKNCARDEQRIAREIDKISDEIEKIAGLLLTSNSTIASLRNKLRNNSASVGNCANKIKTMSDTLDRIAEIYETTEKRIGGNEIGLKDIISDIRDRIEKIIDDIRIIFGPKGMDNSSCYSPDPVNLSNGNYVYEKNFFSFDNILSMNLRIFYNVQDKNPGVLGKGWVHNFAKKIDFENDFAVINDDDGSDIRFLLKEEKYVPVEGVFGEFFRTDNGYSYINQEKINYVFDSKGYITEQITPDGWKISYFYDGNLLSRVECTDEISLSFSYKEGMLASVADHTGRTVAFEYENGMLCKVVDPEGNTTGYGYDAVNRLCEIINSEGQLALKNYFDENDRTMKQIFPDGGVVEYSYNDPERLVVMTRQNGSEVSYYHDEYFRNVRTVYTDGEELTEYNRDHQKVAFTDKIGNVSRYIYDPRGNLSGFINALGEKIEFVYNNENQVNEIIVAGNVIVSAEYDEKNHQISNTDANGGKIFYEYDDMGRVICITQDDESKTHISYDKKGNITEVKDPVTGLTSYEYDECSRVTKTTDALGNVTVFEYDKLDRITRVINAKGDVRKYSYDSRGNIIEMVDFNGGVSTFVYNEINKPVKFTDADGNSTEFEYDLMWNPVKKTVADGGVYTYGYDAEGRMTSICDPMGGTEESKYDPMGNLIQRTAADGGIYTLEYDALGRVVSVTEPTGGKKSAEYDALGNVLSVTYEDGSKEYNTYDPVGNRLTYTDPSGNTKYFEYDSLGNLTLVKDDCGILAEYEYLPGGLLKQETRENGSVVKYSYDAVGNVKEIDDNFNGTWKFEYDAVGNIACAIHGESIEKYTYDASGNITSVTDGCGNVTEYKYSPAGALTLVKDANGIETGYEYDPCYRLKAILQPEDGILLADDFNKFNREQKAFRVTEYTRDLNGNVLSVKSADGTFTQFAYDACGRIISKTDADDFTVSCKYRPDGKEEEICFSDGKSIRYEYDALNKLASVEDWLGITRFQRDELGRVTEVESSDNQVTSYIWGDRGECREIVYPNQKCVSYDYNKNMMLSSCKFDDKQVAYNYYPNGKLKEKVFGNNFSTRYNYDSLGRVSEIRNLKGNDTLDFYSYEYDLCDRKSRLVEMHNDDNMPGGDFTFRYTPVGALESVERNGALYQKFEYDIFGNRTAMYNDGLKTTYSYDKFGRLCSSVDKNREVSYSYDNRGNLRETVVNGIKKLSLHFNALNRLSAAESDGMKASYIYNGLDMLVGKNIAENGRDITERFSYDYSRDFCNLINVERDGSSQSFVWGSDLIASVDNYEASFYFNDERMNPVGIIRNDQFVGRKAYDPFGTEIFNSYAGNDMLADFTFGGYFKDSATGMYNANKRYYDANNGRFVSCDPVAGSITRPVSLNPYVYCTSDPFNYYDPTGMIVAWLAGGIVGAVVNAGGRLAGDIVKSVKNGKWSGSSWQDYAGSIAGGFVEGSVFVVAGPTAAGAAGAATETLVSNGLKMVTKEEGYRKEDGYNIGDLLGDTAKSGAKGAATGFVFGKAAEYIKIPGISKGRGSYSAVWQQVMTKAQKGIIKNVTLKTMYKGLVSHGIVKTVDTIVKKGYSEVKDWAKNKALDVVKDWFNKITGGSTAAASANINKILPQYLSAKCPAAD